MMSLVMFVVRSRQGYSIYLVCLCVWNTVWDTPLDIYCRFISEEEVILEKYRTTQLIQEQWVILLRWFEFFFF